MHEAYIRLVDVKRWDSRGHFLSAAAEAMRRLLVEQYRRKQRIEHGGQLQRVPLPDIVADRPEDNLEAMDEALTELAAEDELAAKVVELRYFAGLGHEQIAEFTGVSVYEAPQKVDVRPAHGYAKSFRTAELAIPFIFSTAVPQYGALIDRSSQNGGSIRC